MLNPLWDWIQINQTGATILVTSSLLLLVASAALLPVAVRLLPADYFVSRYRERQAPRRLPLPLYVAYLMGKNVLGAVLLVAGIAMLVLPGQGILTLLVALILLDFPGKYRLERRVVRYPWVIRSINWIRRRWDAPPMEPPPDEEKS